MKLTRAARNLLKKGRLRTVLSFGFKGYLSEIGWFNAFEKNTPVDSHNKPLPWFTYSFIDFLQDRLPDGLRIFEYGSGSSTRYFAEHGAEIVSVEHDKSWFEKGLTNKPESATLIFKDLDQDGEYCRAIHGEEENFDVVIIDGRDRVNCSKQAYNRLKEGGVIIWDDSERLRYDPGRKFLISKGFREIAFSGISPGLFYRKSTSIFYKSANCLNI